MTCKDCVHYEVCEIVHHYYGDSWYKDYGCKTFKSKTEYVKRERGEWEKSEDDYCGLNIIKCSRCREEWCFEVEDDVEQLNYNFCPNCGADMR